MTMTLFDFVHRDTRLSLLWTSSERPFLSMFLPEMRDTEIGAESEIVCD